MKEIPNYNGKYLIDRSGNIFSRVKNRNLVPTLGVRGYMIVSLNKKTRYVHQLVVETFVDKNYKSKNLVVDHKDKNKLNNKIDNLRITNKSENGINCDREFKLCIFQRRVGGNFYVIFRKNNKVYRGTFMTPFEALLYRLSLEKLSTDK